MPEEGISAKLKKLPYALIALLYASVFTGFGYFFVYFAKFLRTIPQNIDLPWLLVFAAAFLFLLVRNRIKVLKADQKPKLS